MSQEPVTTMPNPPQGVHDPEQLGAAEERWEKCPLRDCKRDNELLYEDFYLRDIRTNRLMCSACAVRAEMGYMAREVIKASDDRFFQGSQSHNFIVLGVMTGAGILAGFLVAMVAFIYVSFILAAAVGGASATLARRLTQRKVTRQMHYFGAAGIVLGAILGVALHGVFVFGIPIEIIFSTGYGIFDMIITAAGMFTAAWGVLLRRI